MNAQGLQAAREAGLRFALGNVVLAAGGLVIDATAATFETVNTIVYAIDGVFKSKAADGEIPFSTGHATVPAGFSCLFVVGIDAAGAVTTYQGDMFKSEVDQAGATKYRAYNLVTNAAGTVTPTKTSKLVATTSELLLASPAVPPATAGVAVGIPDNICVIGAIKIVAASADFVPNTTALTGVSTFYDFAGVLPAATAL